ncbi:TNF receptor-associated factor 6-like [Clytia hemisphaerica]|uniref:TNF receptor-associated factor 6-like n=1 Tax=Clytia hemisphaerica TaxID=252671 RepID=UPI0034D616C2
MAASRDHGKNNTSGYSSSSSDEDVNIGFPFEFLETADFQCIICTHVIRGFTELPCGHAGCKLCIEEWEKRKVACCECQTAYDKTKKHGSLYNDRKIKHEKQAHCKQHEKGCTWQGSIDDYKQQHRKKCAFRNVRCRLCNQKVARQEKDGHKLTCTHRLVNCITCGAQYSFINKKKHEDEECKVPCDYWQYGCHEKIHKRHMERHLANSARRHIELVKAYYDRIVAEKEKRLVMKNKAIAEKDKLLGEKNSSLVEKDKSLAEKDKLLVGKDESLTEKNRLLAEKDKSLAEKDKLLVEKDESLTEKNRSLAEKDKSLAEKNRSLAEKEKSLAEKNRSIIGGEGQIIGRKKSIDYWRRRTNHWPKKIDRLLAEKDKSLAEKNRSIIGGEGQRDWIEHDDCFTKRTHYGA